jgi:hypothetical protein
MCQCCCLFMWLGVPKNVLLITWLCCHCCTHAHSSQCYALAVLLLLQKLAEDKQLAADLWAASAAAVGWKE